MPTRSATPARPTSSPTEPHQRAVPASLRRVYRHIRLSIGGRLDPDHGGQEGSKLFHAPSRRVEERKTEDAQGAVDQERNQQEEDTLSDKHATRRGSRGPG